MTARRTATENHAELTRLQRMRDDLEDELSDKKLSQEKRKKLETELANTRKAIGNVVVR